VFLGLFYFLITSVDTVGFWWFKIKNWFYIRRKNQSYSKTQQGLSLLIQGRWKKAERFLIAGADQSQEPLMNYLAAARAAQEQSAFDRRDQYIQKSYQIAPHADLAIGLTKADLEIRQEQFEQAVATLNRLRQLSPRHPQVLRLLEKVYVRLADWKQVQLLLPSMRKAKLLTSEQYYLFEKNIYCELFRASSEKRLSDVRALWQEVPRYLRKNPEVVCAYASQLMRHAPVTGVETTKEIEELIRKTLKSSWQPELVSIYGKLNLRNLNRQLVIVGAWLKMYGPHPELLLLLGKICVRVQLWGKAKDYFERCLAQGKNAEASLDYGRLLEQLGESEDALRVYKEALVSEEFV
jgi:HemY protein